MGMTLADVDRWEAEAVDAVASALEKRVTSVGELKEALSKLPIIGVWKGQAGPAAEASIERLAKYLMEHADAQQASAAAMHKSVAEIYLLKRMLNSARAMADEGNFTIEYTTGEVAPRNKSCDPKLRAEIVDRVQKVLALADTADADLLHAVNLMDGTDKPGDLPHVRMPTGDETGEAALYGATQKAKDEEILRTAPASAEAQAASERLRDYNTITNPGTGADAKKYAAERLNDFRAA